MAILSQLLRPLPAARRAYSVFSKPGGRYFNSAKPPKVSPSTGKGKVDVSNPSSDAVSAKDQSTSQQHGTPLATEGLSSIHPSSVTPIHPVFNPQDLKLHQFFSLHRPLLLASQPASSIFEISPSSSPPDTLKSSSTSVDGFAEPPEVSAEDDAETARQLARAMVVNRIGASMSWEQTLHRLGLDVTKGRAEEVKLAEAEFEVYMDSTKRKRKKMMRTHKLKKRRRLTRSKIRQLK